MVHPAARKLARSVVLRLVVLDGPGLTYWSYQDDFGWPYQRHDWYS
jgi:hypothetical protein